LQKGCPWLEGLPDDDGIFDRIRIGDGEGVIRIEERVHGAAGTAEQSLVLVVELLHGGLDASQTIERFAAADESGVGRGPGSMRRSGAEVDGALLLNAIELDVQGANLGAKAVLLGDASLKAVDIERDDVQTRGGKSCSERAKQGQAFFEKFQVACGFSAHGSGPFVQFVFLVLACIQIDV
jgi:hypothetical protein